MNDWIPIDLALDLFRESTGVEPHVRDMGALQSSLMRPYSDFGGTEFYSTLHEKAAALLESVNRNHALLDGNKRLSFVLVLALYGIHGVEPQPDVFPSPEEIDVFIRRVASDEVSFDEIVTWLQEIFDGR